jgi:hypothetical protein
MTVTTSYPLRLPKSLKAAAEELSKAEGTSLNQFVATAVAEKIAVLKTAAYFENRSKQARAASLRGEPSVLTAILSRPGGEPPRKGDELPLNPKALNPARTAQTGKRGTPASKRTAQRKSA